MTKSSEEWERERELVIIPRRIPAALITLVQTRRGQPGPGELRNNGCNDSPCNVRSQFNPAQQSELDSQNPTQQSKWIPAVTAGSGGPLWPGHAVMCWVMLGNAISAIGELIVSIFYREEIRLVHSENVRTSAHLSTWCLVCTLVSKF